MQAHRSTRDPWLSPVPLAQLRRLRQAEIDLTPDAATCAALAEALGIVEIRKLRMQGRITALGREDWEFRGELGATVVQECVVTLAPVTSRIDEKVERRFLAGWDDPEGGSETEMPEDEDAEPLGDAIDPGAIMAEALALALPPWPRAEGVELPESLALEVADQNTGEQRENPFAKLAELQKRQDK